MRFPGDYGYPRNRKPARREIQVGQFPQCAPSGRLTGLVVMGWRGPDGTSGSPPGIAPRCCGELAPETGWAGGGGRRAPANARELVTLAESQQAFRLCGPGAHGGGRLRLAPVDPVVVPAWPDLGPLGGEGGPHHVGEGPVQILAEPVQVGERRPGRLRVTQCMFRVLRACEQAVEPLGERGVSLVLALSVFGNRLTPGDREHGTQPGGPRTASDAVCRD